MAQQGHQPDEASSELSHPAPLSLNQTSPVSTMPFAAPSLEGWPPVSHVSIASHTRDIVMSENIPPPQENPLLTETPPSVQSTTPVQAATKPALPSRATTADTNVRASSQHSDVVSTMPKEAPSHGAPTRRFLNENVTGVLLDGLKMIAKDRPSNPLRSLGEYLIERSKENRNI
ncbi:hypothetical protein BGHDH14_bgh01183 [Blumeria hordei DH14]|uniref:Dpy-30 domain-containing protein n=1 Tax=Blumeria graminis f. sp. hordei (strain DH14) TaxID=546991 RepID=N1J9E5_BLUG1|nr:hypothetical protein BGHDH14_bgh01183 [Blumeria hordei DH14]